MLSEKEYVQADEFYDNLKQAADGYPLDIVETVVSIFMAKLATKYNPSEKNIRELYNDLASAAIDMMKHDSNKLQTTENTTSKEEGATPKQKTWNVTGPSSIN